MQQWTTSSVRGRPRPQLLFGDQMCWAAVTLYADNLGCLYSKIKAPIAILEQNILIKDGGHSGQHRAWE